MNTCIDIVEMELCEVCTKNAPKYRCPACAVRTCCVICVKEHKRRSKCNGKRCKTAFVSLPEFSDSQLFSDYYFLEDVSRHGDASKRDRIHLQKQLSDTKEQRQNFHWLRSRATDRGTTLLLQPSGMSLHKMNTSRTVFNKQSGKWTIEWRVHLIFPHCGEDYQERHVPESTVLHKLLNKYLHPTDSDPIIKHRLRLYIEKGGIAEVTVLMKSEKTTCQESRYHVLDKDKTLCDNFKNKTIFEFPTLTIILSSQLKSYTLKNSVTESGCIDTHPLDRVNNEQHVRCSSTHNSQQMEEPEEPLKRRNSSDWSEDESECNSLQLIARMYS